MHGAFHAAWCWDEHFLDFFAARSFGVVAMSLRGHGSSPTPKPITRCSIADYVDDLREVIRSLPTTPILVGHSMGGFIVQKYLENADVPAAVLLASTPPVGQHRSLIRLSRRHPIRSLRATMTARPSAMFSTPTLVRESFFTERTSDDVVIRTHGRLEEDSPRAVIADMAALDLVNTTAITTPVMVIGGENDALYPPQQLHDTAHRYGADAHIIAGAGHDLMLDTSWAAAADSIIDLLAGRGL